MYRKVEIEAVVNGFIVRVGCQLVVVISLDTLLSELRRYYQDPAGTEKAYLSTPHARHVAVEEPSATFAIPV